MECPYLGIGRIFAAEDAIKRCSEVGVAKAVSVEAVPHTPEPTPGRGLAA
jgi:hypothetical protein